MTNNDKVLSKYNRKDRKDKNNINTVIHYLENIINNPSVKNNVNYDNLVLRPVHKSQKDILSEKL